MAWLPRPRGSQEAGFTQPSLLLVSHDGAISCRTLRPEPVRPVPPLHLDEEEMMWTNPMDSDYSHHFELFYDRSMCDAHASLNETKRLMARACKGPLSPANTNQGRRLHSKFP